MDTSDKADIKAIEKALRSKCVETPEVYLNEFFERKMKPGERINTYCQALEKLLDKAGISGDSREKLLSSRLISQVPLDVKNFMELMSDKSWKDLVHIFENQTDYKKQMSEFMNIGVNKIETP